MDPDKLRRAYSIGWEGACWHCGGSGLCNCAACGAYSVGLAVVAGPCLVHTALANQGMGGHLGVQLRKAGEGTGVSRARANRIAPAREVLRPDCQPCNTLFDTETSSARLPMS